MYRAASPIFDVHEFPSLRHVKPLPKRRRTSSGSQSDTDVGLGPTSTTPGVNGHPFNLTHLTNYPQSHSPTNPSSSSLSSTTPNSNSNLNHSIPLSSYPLPMSASDAAATAAIAEELLAQAAGSIMSRSALQHLQNFMPDLWNAALAAATAGIGATSTSGLNGSDFVGQSAGSRMQGDLDFDAYAAAAAGVASDNSVLVDHLEEALDAVNHAHHEDEDEDEENDDEGGYNTDHLHQHYGHGNTKKRKVPANSSGSSMMRHHRGDEDEDEDDEGDDGSRLEGALSNGGRLGDNHHGYSSSAVATSGPSSGVGSGGGPGTLSSPTSTSMSPQTLVGHPHHHRQPYTPLSRRAKITAATLAGLQHKEMLKSRKRQLAAVLGALSLGDTLALDQALSASYPFLMGGSSGATSGRRHTSSSAGGGGLEEYAQAMGLLTTGSGSGGTTTTSMGTKNMDASLPRVRLSKRQNVRLMRKTKVLIIARRKELELVERQRREDDGEGEGVVVAQRKVRDQQQQQRKEQERKGAQTSTPTTKSGKKDKSKKAGAGKGSVPLALPAPPPPPPPSSLEETMGKALQRYEPQLQITQLASFPESGFSFVCPSSSKSFVLFYERERVFAN
ncbi:hypothetical protein BDN72DRAFT_619552 [Pluteus cervinus]|uniref:Uncharacterized protein n=1 Tax=Pluteus cervinus TaxID=181527 RepID=A0ACD3AUE6_9AGAR|nr:hypothetical protein BDN72DRAFT_619552 [Pluteus cervinus]